MGFFYKAGAAEGVTVVEGASYDALATSAKTQAHGVLMKDTSTGFYYKNWKTGGPGIPVPVRFFDDVSGYCSNSGSLRPNAYFTLDDAEADIVSATAGEDWTAVESTGSISKTAGNPLVMAAATSNKACLFRFYEDSGSDKIMGIMKISSITWSGGASANKGNFVFPNATGTSLGYFHYLNFNAISGSTETVKLVNAAGTSVLSEGDNFELTAPEWIIFTSNATAADSGWGMFSTKSTAIGMGERSTAGSGAISNQALLLQVASSSSVAAEMQIGECHLLSI